MATVPVDRLEGLPGLKSEAPIKSEEPPLRGYVNRADRITGTTTILSNSVFGI